MAYTVINGKLVRTRHGRPTWPNGVAKKEQATNKPDKGDYAGSCNRTACQRPGASWFNHSTRRYYCVDCAWELNNDPFNKRDAQQLYGHDLCTEGPNYD